jgi:hypothetical protein
MLDSPARMDTRPCFLMWRAIICRLSETTYIIDLFEIWRNLPLPKGLVYVSNHHWLQVTKLASVDDFRRAEISAAGQSDGQVDRGQPSEKHYGASAVESTKRCILFESQKLCKVNLTTIAFTGIWSTSKTFWLCCTDGLNLYIAVGWVRIGRVILPHTSFSRHPCWIFGMLNSLDVSAEHLALK